jgi:hypothetical protein
VREAGEVVKGVERAVARARAGRASKEGWAKVEGRAEVVAAV